MREPDERDERRLVREAGDVAARAGALARVAMIVATMAIALAILGLFLPIRF